MTLIRDGAGKPHRTMAVIEDITPRRLAEEAIRTSLAEKEVLLKEIHHRVKNNLQVISSLLNMQSRFVRDAEDLDAFRASMDRVRSMALIHDKLYRSSNLASIHFPDYVKDLCSELLRTYAFGRDIKMNISVADIEVDIDRAMPLGLIINELVSNSLKHAFPGTADGGITVSLQGRGQVIELAVSDTGVGFPEALDFRETESLGMQLVMGLVEQLDGTITSCSEGGAEFRISFHKGT